MAAAKGPPAVVCLAAGRWQEPVIRSAKALGLAVLAVDRDASAAGFAHCDERLLLGTWEPLPIVAALRPLARRYDLRAVLVRSAGPPVVAGAEIAHAFGLPGVPPGIARRVIDKVELMAACAQLGIPAPAALEASDAADVDAERLPPPWVVKPALSLVGKSGVRKVAHAADLPAAIDAARHASLDGRVSVQEFVPGRDVGLVAFVREGRLVPLTLVDEINAAEADGGVRGRGVAVPSMLSGGPEEARILALARCAVERLGLGTTPFMLSCRCEPLGGPKLIELHLDLGGDRILDALLPHSAGLDVLSWAIALLAGEPAGPPPPPLRPAAVLFGSDGPGGDGHTVLDAGDRRTLEARLGAPIEVARA